MRIALDATYSIDPQPSGIAIYSQELLAGLARALPDDEFLHCYRIKQFGAAAPPAFRNVRRRILLPPLATFRADVFHALNQRVDRRPAPNVVVTFHDLFVITGEYSSAEFRARFTQQARRAAENADVVIAVSQFTANQVRTLLNVDASRIRVVPHGVREPIARANVAREKIVLFAGALQIRKNIARLVEAFESLPADWKLVLAGAPNGYGAGAILDRIERSRCRDRIQLTGYVAGATLENLYARATVFAFPSLDEGFGMPVLEAMAHGVPVVTSNRSALPEVAGDAALFVDPEDTDALRDALRRLIQDCDLRCRLTALGYSRAKLFTWEQTAKSTYAVYRELAGKQKTSEPTLEPTSNPISDPLRQKS